MEYVDGLTKDEPEPRRWPAPPRETRTCWTCGLLRDEQESLSQCAATAASAGHNDVSLFPCGLTLSSASSGHVVILILPPEPMTAKNWRPMFPTWSLS